MYVAEAIARRLEMPTASDVLRTLNEEGRLIIVAGIASPEFERRYRERRVFIDETDAYPE